MYHISLGILHQQEDAENAVQDAFLCLMEHFERYADLSGGDMRNLCVCIVKNKCMDILRKKKRYSDRELEELVLCEESLLASPEEMLLYSEREQQAAYLLKHLPEIYKEVMVLKYYYNYSIKDISRLLGVSAKVVDQRLFRAKKMIRRMLEDEK